MATTLSETSSFNELEHAELKAALKTTTRATFVLTEDEAKERIKVGPRLACSRRGVQCHRAGTKERRRGPLQYCFMMVNILHWAPCAEQGAMRGSNLGIRRYGDHRVTPAPQRCGCHSQRTTNTLSSFNA